VSTCPFRITLPPRYWGLLVAVAGWLFCPLDAETAALLKPTKTVLLAGHDPRRIAVKFRDGLNVRLRGNALVSTNAALFARSRSLFDTLSVGAWERADMVSENAIDDLRHRAEQRLGYALPDLNLQFYLTLPPGMDAAATIDKLNQLEVVELAQPVPRCAPPPLPPNYESSQTYCQAVPVGCGVFNVWTNYGVFGAGVHVADVEYSYNSNHLDLPAIINLDATAVDPFGDDNHGTATLGEISALENGWGTTGIGRGAAFYFAGANYQNGYDVGRGITTAANQLQEGDILLIEQQLNGPNTTQDVMNYGGQYGDVPVEWYGPYYDRIQMAAGLGIVVIEAAGNGGQNLDDPIYSTGNGGNWPFLPQNNSGAILVGAGASANGSSTERSRLDFSNYGSRLDMQGWGENIVTTGYGDLYSSEGPNLYYTSTFGGTSGATPIVVGGAVLLQSVYRGATGRVLTPLQIKMLLGSTGLPQTGGAYPVFASIGPMPNLPLAISTALSNLGPPAIVMFSTNATALIGGNATLSVAASGAVPITYQWRFNGSNLTDSATVYGSTKAVLILNNLAVAKAGSYSVVVSNNSGRTSAAAILSVMSDPALTPGVTLTNLYNFTDASDGSGPVGLTSDGQGDFFGVQEYGGSNGYGGIFEFTPDTSAFSIIYSFTDGNDGANPLAPMVLGSDGNFYGTTSVGGQYDYGAIFSLSPSGTVQPLYTFTGQGDGGYPEGSLVEGTNQLFYGTAYSGGSAGSYGVVFTVDASGNYNVIHAFDYSDGSGPEGGLVLAGDGNFYGTTDYGGAHNDGTIFRISPDGTFFSLFSFSSNNGATPTDKLVQGIDGKLFGRTYYGGDHGKGTIFCITTNGAFQSLFSFNGSNGANPQPALCAGNDGNFYGVTVYGGTNDQDGVIYEISPGGAFSIVGRFDGTKGRFPYAPLVRGDDGNFYGTTFQGGYGDGVIFRLSFASTPQPSFQSLTGGGGRVSLTWGAVPGRSYQLQFTTNLSQPNWVPLGAPITATNILMRASDALPQTGQMFYRLVVPLP
jgi:serine protease